jgi:DedD protein
MHDHNLDDLIIDNIEPKNSKTKSFLTIIALMIVVLIVAIILTKILLKTPDENRLAYEEDTTELIAPELQLKETPKPKKAEEEPSFSNMIESKPQAPLVETKKEHIEPSTVVVQKEPELSNLEDQEVEAPVSESSKQSMPQKPSLTIQEQEAKDAADIAYWKKVQEKRKAEQIAYESTESAKPTVTVKEEAVKPKPVVTSVKKPAKKPVSSKPVPKTVSTGRYYVQVGAYRQQPSRRFMSVIQNNGYKYIMTKPNRSGIKRLLIGPYMDRESVNRALIEVRDRIHKQAFITTR